MENNMRIVGGLISPLDQKRQIVANKNHGFLCTKNELLQLAMCNVQLFLYRFENVT